MYTSNTLRGARMMYPVSSCASRHGILAVQQSGAGFDEQAARTAIHVGGKSELAYEHDTGTLNVEEEQHRAIAAIVSFSN
jgi:hypothetical protein